MEAESVDLVVSRAMLHWLPLPQYGRFFDGAFRVLRPSGWVHSESAGAGNVACVTREADEVAAEYGLEQLPPFPDAGAVFDLVEASSFDMPEEAVRTIAQRRTFSRDEPFAFLRSQASVALTRNAPPERAEELADALTATVDRLAPP